jgi:ketosteroid isomerase-like protein
MNRGDIVRAAYQRFNHKDFEGVLELCDPEVEFRDLLSEDGTAYGFEALRQRWAERFSEASAHVTVGDVVEVGDTVIAAACYQAYDRHGVAVGPYVPVTDQFNFRGHRILRIEATQFSVVPDEVKSLLRPPTPSAPG